MNFIVYCLKEPDTGEIRYFGKTGLSVKRRFLTHLYAKNRTYVCKWVSKLKTQDKLPVWETLATGCDNFTACEIEKALIKMGRETGMRLTNLTDGGEGAEGFHHSPETKAKMSESRLGKPKSLKHRAALRGKRHSLETRKRMSESQRGNKNWLGKKHSLATKKKMRGNKNRLGKKASSETREKISSSMRGNKNAANKKATREK